MKVAVLGSGNGGCAVAYEWAAKGNEVRLFDFDRFPKQIEAVRAAGGITARGKLNGFAPIAYVGHDIKEALSGTDLVFVVGPAYSTELFARACIGAVEDGMIFVIMPASCFGALVFKSTLEADGEKAGKRLYFAETSTLPYAVRITAPATITLFNRFETGGGFLSALPASDTDYVYEKVMRGMVGIAKGKNVFQTTLQNGNVTIHPAVSLMNAALIERTHGDFMFYEEGVTPAVGRVMKSVDDEKLAIAAALDVTVQRDSVIGVEQGYMTEASYDRGYAEAPGFKGIKAQDSLDHRYFNEDVDYSLVCMVSLAEQLGVATPTMRALIQIISVAMDRDYFAEAPRTMRTLGWAEKTAAELKVLVS
ncbi:MAG: opine dehydrogenase [Clostridiaceae bacterium]|nr:opine dehydrogenase [Clostridiaceae bacterium]